ncbi:hypothetical protein HDU96_001557, partial [Phlyctochytrium bullatum]
MVLVVHDHARRSLDASVLSPPTLGTQGFTRSLSLPRMPSAPASNSSPPPFPSPTTTTTTTTTLKRLTRHTVELVLGTDSTDSTPSTRFILRPDSRGLELALSFPIPTTNTPSSYLSPPTPGPTTTTTEILHILEARLEYEPLVPGSTDLQDADRARVVALVAPETALARAATALTHTDVAADPPPRGAPPSPTPSAASSVSRASSRRTRRRTPGGGSVRVERQIAAWTDLPRLPTDTVAVVGDEGRRVAIEVPEAVVVGGAAAAAEAVREVLCLVEGVTEREIKDCAVELVERHVYG